MSDAQKAAHQFVAGLHALDPPELKALRSATGRRLGADVGVYDIFQSIFRPVRRWALVSKWSCYTIATLYPWHPQLGAVGMSLAHALCFLRPPASDKYGRSRMDGRFVRLLDARGSVLTLGLASAVHTLSSREIPVDWALLLGDLSHWYAAGKPTQTRWSDTYFTD